MTSRNREAWEPESLSPTTWLQQIPHKKHLTGAQQGCDQFVHTTSCRQYCAEPQELMFAPAPSHSADSWPRRRNRAAATQARAMAWELGSWDFRFSIWTWWSGLAGVRSLLIEEGMTHGTVREGQCVSVQGFGRTAAFTGRHDQALRISGLGDQAPQNLPHAEACTCS